MFGIMLVKGIGGVTFYNQTAEWIRRLKRRRGQLKGFQQ
jgi:hypothetical protein